MLLKNIQYKKIYNECIICFENIKKNELPIQLNEQEIYLKLCNCNPYIHISCLKIWVNLNYDCPICRNKIFENKLYEFTYGFYIIYYTISFYNFLKIIINKIVIFIIKSKFLLLFFYLLINIFTQIYELSVLKFEL